MSATPRWCAILPALLLAAAGLAGHGVHAQEQPVRHAMPSATAGHVDPATGLRFPNALARLAYQRMVTYDDDKLGYCVLYASLDARAQICVYDLGYKDLPPGIDSAPFKEALALAVDGTLLATGRAPFRNGKLVASGTPSIDADGKVARAEMRMFASELADIDGSFSPQLHLILLTAGFGRILKLNYTSDQDAEAFETQAEKIVEDFVRFNGDTMKRLLLAPARAP